MAVTACKSGIVCECARGRSRGLEGAGLADEVVEGGGEAGHEGRSGRDAVGVEGRRGHSLPLLLGLGDLRPARAARAARAARVGSRTLREGAYTLPAQAPWLRLYTHKLDGAPSDRSRRALRMLQRPRRPQQHGPLRKASVAAGRRAGLSAQLPAPAAHARGCLPEQLRGAEAAGALLIHLGARSDAVHGHVQQLLRPDCCHELIQKSEYFEKHFVFLTAAPNQSRTVQENEFLKHRQRHQLF